MSASEPPVDAVAASEQHDPTKGVRVRQGGKKPGPTPEAVAPAVGDDTSAIPAGVPVPPVSEGNVDLAAAVAEASAGIEQRAAAAEAILSGEPQSVPIMGVASGPDGVPIGDRIEIGRVTFSADELEPDLVRAVVGRAFGPLPDVEVSSDGLKAYVPLSTGPTMTVQLSDRPEVILEFVSAALALYYHVLEQS